MLFLERKMIKNMMNELELTQDSDFETLEVAGFLDSVQDIESINFFILAVNLCMKLLLSWFKNTFFYPTTLISFQIKEGNSFILDFNIGSLKKNQKLMAFCGDLNIKNDFIELEYPVGTEIIFNRKQIMIEGSEKKICSIIPDLTPFISKQSNKYFVF